MARVRRIGGTELLALDQGWEFTAVAPGAVQHPRELQAATVAWRPAQVPGTVASAIRAAGAEPTGEGPFDAHDYWFRCQVTPPAAGTPTVLRLGGLASIADVFWNGTLVLSSTNMFLAHQVTLTGGSGPGELAIRFRALGSALAERRPRPRWRTAIASHQQLRWFRTTLLGRIPAWTPPIAPVGPYRPIELAVGGAVTVLAADVRSRLEAGDGQVDVALRLRPVDGKTIDAVTVTVGDGPETALTCQPDTDGTVVARGTVQVRRPARWWPHTHGDQPLYAVGATVASGRDRLPVDLGTVGFRTVRIDERDNGFTLLVNDTPIFCRGACWTPVDLVSLAGTEAGLRPTLAAAAAAGMNMLRVGGTMIYETDAFYRLCDELGILVWQDFMFANFDYPVADPTFAASITDEVRQFLDRVQTSPCIAVLCGNSEVEQQAAMVGASRDLWRNDFFAETLPGLCTAGRPDVPYWPSSPSGGVLPFLVSEGVAHYYGVGAYCRPLTDARRANVRFTTECLAFANVPDDRMIETLLPSGEAPFHHPRWKQGVPRDAGASWDFEDVRDHYTGTLFGVDPTRLRWEDPEAFLALARVTSGEVMAATLGDWRRAGSLCHGALIWFLRDLVPGAGFGLLDAAGRPKAAYYYAKRAMAPVALLLADEGLDGLELHAVNDGPTPLAGFLELALYRRGEIPVATHRTEVAVPPRSVTRRLAAGMLDHFLDTTYAYKFGPASHDLAVATWRAADSGAVLGQAFHFVGGLGSLRRGDVGLEATCEPGDEGAWNLRLKATRLARSVAITVRGFLPSDNFFHMAPGGERLIRLVPDGSQAAPQGTALPLNAHAPTKIAGRRPEGAS